MTVLILLLTMAIMVGAAEVFTNAVEWLGHRLKLGEGAVGSVLAAVGTALPETLVPIVALIRGGEGSHTVSVGAILGAPFMLATLALFLSGAAVLVFRGTREPDVHTNAAVTRRDAGWFLVMFAALLAGSLLPAGWPRIVLAIALLVGYGMYVWRTLVGSQPSAHDLRPLYFGGRRPGLLLIVLQLVVALLLLGLAAHFFVGAIEALSTSLGLPLIALSLLLVPLATELPEKFNSILWLYRRQDTLAIGNITGAMVFQAAIPGAIGLLFTDWKLDSFSWLTAGFALASIAGLWLWLTTRGKLPALLLMPAGALYFIYVGLVLH